ncbi:MAG: hypothetical protein AVDCRST_MAG37-3570 [uncultured Rubrobacteraceae bacterium]|uniref:SCP2 domain-containing protein n=1 Tax=uncultured Rubrobacteraceae bacterium TaxID=349277 RepID=A0A6J4QZH0_9ACTN|nr:MAG: hypothetical protein AVDCRST_MAG37-3570 [uncultured Rubrobacteraceae bacterium]
MTTETLTADRWVDEFARVSNEDPEIQAHGKYYTCSFLLDMEEHQFLIRMNAGKVEEILVDPGPLDLRYQFIIRASAETWRNFGKETPPPMYHGIWSASFQRDMKLEGDLLVLMQNLRTLTRQIELLRQTGVPV